uniref:Uncharacterized protein n=1 Tax=Glossina pallidipes TaxID=7398 RepID=A0A1B0AH17_GLOPL
MRKHGVHTADISRSESPSPQTISQNTDPWYFLLLEVHVSSSTLALKMIFETFSVCSVVRCFKKEYTLLYRPREFVMSLYHIVRTKGARDYLYASSGEMYRRTTVNIIYGQQAERRYMPVDYPIKLIESSWKDQNHANVD